MRRGFTLIEMLVVIGILALLMGILLPMVIRAVRSGDRAKASAQIQSIAAALESYHQSFGDYPRLPEANLAGTAPAPRMYGSDLLLWALIAPRDATQDGAEGPGFRKRGMQGQVYGPYLPIEKFKYDNIGIQDSFGNNILYIPARPAKPNLGATNGFIAGNAGALYDSRYLSNLTEQQFRYMMGDLNTNGQIDGNEQPVSTAPYILWSAGSDGTYGPAALNATDVAKCDDVTNFR
jgi:prepilin-type N-terminal cleavage/methylation domain-containing protein